MAASGGASASTSATGGGGSEVDASIAKYKAAQSEAAAESMRVATEVTKINGIYNAIKKISPA